MDVQALAQTPRETAVAADVHIKQVLLRLRNRKRSPLVRQTFNSYKLNPDWHYRHNNAMSLSEKAYIAQHYRTGAILELSIDLGRTDRSIRAIYHQMKNSDKMDFYLTLDTTLFLDRLAREEQAFLERTGFTE